MSKIAWKTDPETKDLSFIDEEMLEILENSAVIARGVTLTLEAWRGGFELVPSYGTDYEQMLGIVVGEETTDGVLRKAVPREEQITIMENLGVIQGEDRKMTVTWLRRLNDEKTIDMEMSTSG